MAEKSDKSAAASDDPDVPASDLHEDSFVLLRSVRRSLAHLLRQVEEGEIGVLKSMIGHTSELEKSLRLAIETELKFKEWKAQHDRALSEHDIDFEAVRFEIGCRLARIRECCDEGSVPQRVEQG